MTFNKVYLSSQSPRRAELLRQMQLAFEALLVAVDETPLAQEAPKAYVERLALAKAVAGLQQAKEPIPVIAADTAVVIDEHIMGKPTSFADACSMWQKLSGQTHQVYSGVAVVTTEQQLLKTVVSQVEFATMSVQDMRDYWDSGEPQDKAGAYAIQGLGARFVAHLAGSYSGVVGLPLYETMNLLSALS